MENEISQGGRHVKKETLTGFTQIRKLRFNGVEDCKDTRKFDEIGATTRSCVGKAGGDRI